MSHWITDKINLFPETTGCLALTSWTLWSKMLRIIFIIFWLSYNSNTIFFLFHALWNENKNKVRWEFRHGREKREGRCKTGNVDSYRLPAYSSKMGCRPANRRPHANFEKNFATKWLFNTYKKFIKYLFILKCFILWSLFHSFIIFFDKDPTNN